MRQLGQPVKNLNIFFYNQIGLYITLAVIMLIYFYFSPPRPNFSGVIEEIDDSQIEKVINSDGSQSTICTVPVLIKKIEYSYLLFKEESYEVVKAVFKPEQVNLLGEAIKDFINGKQLDFKRKFIVEVEQIDSTYHIETASIYNPDE